MIYFIQINFGSGSHDFFTRFLISVSLASSAMLYWIGEKILSILIGYLVKEYGQEVVLWIANFMM